MTDEQNARLPIPIVVEEDGIAQGDFLSIEERSQELARLFGFNQEILAGAQQALKGGKSVDEAVSTITPRLEKYKASGLQSQRLKGAVQSIYDEINQKP